ncbi:MAG TPA: sensor histidine kinase [Anaerolineales bacterium]|nr:sensor histidine kinase [Anaerolineales bacterium]
MKSPKEMELGILPTFRLFTGVQFAITALGVITQQIAFFETRSRAITLEPIHLLEPGLIFIYLSIPGLRRSLRSLYLPIGITAAAIGLLIEPYIIGNHTPESFVTWLWRQTLFLCIPLYVVSWQYSMRQVILFSALATIANTILLSFALGFGGLISSSLPVILSVQLILYLLTGYIVVKVMRIQRQQWQQLAEANARLAQYASTVEQLAISRERNRLARELHDVLAHTLSGVAVELEGLRATMQRDPEQATALLNHSLQAIREGLTETRRTLQELRAKPLEDLGLALAIQTLAESYASRSDFQLELEIDPNLGDYPLEVQQSIYRIAQEAIANIADHAQAQNVKVQLKREHDQIQMIIRDDGCGFDPGNFDHGSHYGLLGMHERAEMINGNLSIESQAGKGTQISFSYGDAQ